MASWTGSPPQSDQVGELDGEPAAIIGEVVDVALMTYRHSSPAPAEALDAVPRFASGWPLGLTASNRAVINAVPTS